MAQNAARRRLLDSPANPDAYVTPCWGNFMECIGNCFGFSCLFCFCGCCCNPYQTVGAGHKGVVVRYGRIRQELDPGMHYVNPITENLYTPNMMTHVHKLDSQEVMTADNVPLTIDGDVFWRRTDAVKALFSVTHLVECIDQISHAALRDSFGHFKLSDCMSHRDEVAAQIKSYVGTQVEGWGIVIEGVRVRDIKVPRHIMDGLTSTATAEREGQALIIKARANVEAAKLMHAAAEQLNTPAAMHLRALEVYERLALAEGSKLVFLPADGKIMPSIDIANVVKK